MVILLTLGNIVFVLALIACHFGGFVVVARALKKNSTKPTCLACSYILPADWRTRPRCTECGADLKDMNVVDGEWQLDRKLLLIGLLMMAGPFIAAMMWPLALQLFWWLSDFI